MKKSRLIPIEVLRVEDKIFASLNFLQIGLLSLPLAAAVVLLLLPPAGKLPFFKLAVIVFVFAVSGLLALRLQQRLILHWLILVGRYNCRPKAYLKPSPPRKPLKTEAILARAESLPALDIQKYVPGQAYPTIQPPPRAIYLRDRACQERVRQRQ